MPALRTSERYWRTDLQKQLRGTEVDLIDQNVDDEGARYVAEQMRGNMTVTELYLGNNKIGAEGASALAEMFKVELVGTPKTAAKTGLGGQNTASGASAGDEIALARARHSAAVDQFSFAVMGLELLSNKDGGASRAALQDKEEVLRVLQEECAVLPIDALLELVEPVFYACGSLDPESRPSFGEVAQHLKRALAACESA